MKKEFKIPTSSPIIEAVIEEQIHTVTFTVKVSKGQADKLKQFLKEEGIIYE